MKGKGLIAALIVLAIGGIVTAIVILTKKPKPVLKPATLPNDNTTAPTVTQTVHPQAPLPPQQPPPPPNVPKSSAWGNVGSDNFTLSTGSKGMGVAVLQALANIGDNAGLVIDGDFGPKTKAALGTDSVDQKDFVVMASNYWKDSKLSRANFISLVITAITSSPAARIYKFSDYEHFGNIASVAINTLNLQESLDSQVAKIFNQFSSLNF